MGLTDDIASWIRERVEKADARGIVVGLSGGVDSSCVAVLSQMALGDNVLGLILPCLSGSEDENFAVTLAEKFGIKTEKIVLDTVYENFLEILPSRDKIPVSNLKPRLRMTALYHFANSLNYLVAGTGNKSEEMVGYFTKYGDGGVDMLPLGGLLKTEVKELAKELSVPDAIIARPPSAGLWEGQLDEKELDLCYEDLDKAITAIETTKTKDFFAQEVMTKVMELVRKSEHKRLPIPIYEREKS